MAFTPGMDRSLQVRVESEGVEGFQRGMDGAIDSLFSFRNAVGLAGAALSAFATGALIESVNAARQFEDAMVEVEKVTNPETAAAMSEEIRNMAETIPLAQNELAGMAADAARFGVRGPENIRAFTEAVSKMAVATNLSANEAGESLSRISELTDTSVGNIENLGSAINELSNNFATSSSEITDAMLRSGAALSQLGLNQTQIAGLSAALNEVSESSRRAGTRLRRVAQEMMEPDKVSDLAAALGMTVDEFETMRSESPVQLIEQMATAMAEGGERADALRSTLSTASRQAIAGLAQNTEGMNAALDTSARAFEENTSLQAEFEAQSDTLNAKLQLLQNTLRNNAIEIGNVLLPHVQNVVVAIDDYLSSSDSLLSALTAQQKAWGLVATAVGGAALAVATFVSGPLGLAIAGIAALGAAFAHNLFGIRDVTEQALGQVRAEFERAMGVLRPVVESSLAEVRAAWAENGGRIVSNVTDHMNAVREAIGGGLRFILSNFIRPLTRDMAAVYDRHLGELVSETIETVAVLTDHYETFRNVVGNLWERWGDEITAVAEVVMDVLRVVIVNGLDRLLTGIRVILAAIRGDWSEAWGLIEGVARRSVNRVRNLLESVPMFSGLLSGTRDARNATRRFGRVFMRTVRNVATTARTAFNRVRATVVPIMRFIANNLIIPLVNRIRRVFDRHFPAIQREAAATFNHLRNVVVDVLNFVAPFVRVAMNAIATAFRVGFNIVRGVTDAALTVIGGLWDIFGDEILGVVEFAMDGIVGAIEVALDLVLTTIRVVLALIRTDWRQAWNLITGFFERTMNGVIEFVTEWGTRFLNGLTDAVGEAVDAAMELVNGFVDDVQRALEDVATGIGNATRNALNDALGLPYDYSFGPIEIEGETVVPEQSLTIPALAEGGIVTGPTLAMVGEAGPEAVVPLDKAGGMGGGVGGPTEVVVRFEGEGSLVDLVRDEATVVVNDEFESRHRTVRRLGERGGGRRD